MYVLSAYLHIYIDTDIIHIDTFRYRYYTFRLYKYPHMGIYKYLYIYIFFAYINCVGQPKDGGFFRKKNQKKAPNLSV